MSNNSSPASSGKMPVSLRRMYGYVRYTAVTPGCIADVLRAHHQVINVLPDVPCKFTMSLREMFTDNGELFTDNREMFTDNRSKSHFNREMSAYNKCTTFVLNFICKVNRSFPENH